MSAIAVRPRRRWRWLRRIAQVLLVLLLLGLLYLAWLLANNWAQVRSVPHILSSFTAKEYCSCRYVMRRDEGFCRGFVEQWLAYDALEEDAAARRITARGLGITTTARFVDARTGCRLEAYP